MAIRHMRRIVAVGELLWDMLPGGPRLGGTTTNFAVGIARLGLSSTLLTCIGSDAPGILARSELAQQTHDIDFDMSHVQETDRLPTGTVGVTLDANDSPTYTIVFPVAWDAIALTAENRDVAKTARAICFGTLAQRGEVSRATIRQMVQAVPADCVRVLDVNARLPFCSAEVVRWSLAHATIVKISDEELELVAGYLDIPYAGAKALDIAALTGIAHAILRTAPLCLLIAITLGPSGSLLITRDGSDYHCGYSVQVVDTVGAGDAFTCGLVAGYLHGASLQAINIVGNLCGSYVASKAGATPALSPDLLRKIRETLDGAGANGAGTS